MMRSVFQAGRICLRNGLRRGSPITTSFHTLKHRSHFHFHTHTPRKALQRIKSSRVLLLTALSPAAFVRLGEEGKEHGESSEIHMLEASRQELQEKDLDNSKGLLRALRQLGWAFDTYIFEPIATGFRFLHLVVIFVPVIVATPVVFFGSRKKERDNERAGTLWWYGFLVHSMERAGPAFIKVTQLPLF